MHTTSTTLITLLALAAVVSQPGALAAGHDNIPKHVHASFLRVKRGGGTLHLIGDETVARWSGGSVASPPAISQAPKPSTTSTQNLLDAINAGLGVPVSGATGVNSGTPGDPTKAAGNIKGASVSSSSSPSSKASSGAQRVTNAKGGAAVVALAESVSSAPARSTQAKAGKAGNTTDSSRLAARSHTNGTVVAFDPEHEIVHGRRSSGNATQASSDAPSANSTGLLTAVTDTITHTLSSITETLDSSNPQGWGAPFADGYTTMSVKNHAVRGGSSRIFSRDIWANALSSIKSGDIVVFELGHYDAKIPGSIADKNAGCPGSVPGWGDDTSTVTGCGGSSEVVKTFGDYVFSMCREAQSKGASCIISSLTPKNEWRRDNTVTYNTVYITYAQRVAQALGVPYINHEVSSANALIKAGQATSASYFMAGDSLQTSQKGAEVFAASFAAAAYCAGASSLTSTFTSKAQALQGSLC